MIWYNCALLLTCVLRVELCHQHWETQPTSVILAYPTLRRMCVQLSDESVLFHGADLHLLTI